MNNKVYVGNLSYQTTADDLQTEFAKCGTVTEAKVISDRDTGRSKGFAFVTFESDDQAQRAISEYDGLDFMGRKLKVSIAESKPREKNNNRGDRGGRRDRHADY